jgi:hypothetical protein
MNTGGRLLAIYDGLINQPASSDKAMVWLWAQVFDIPEASPHVEDDVIACLQAMRSEIDLLTSKLKLRGVSDNLLHPGLPRLRNVASPTYLHTSWNSLREEHSRAENRTILLWADWALRDEIEEDLNADELSALQADLNSLEVNLRDVEMPTYLHDFVLRQITLIRSALRISRVRGAAPIKEALRQVVGTCVVERDHVEAEVKMVSEEARSIMAQTGELIKKTAEYADRFEKIRKAGEGAVGLAKTLGPVLLAWVSAHPK